MSKDLDAQVEGGRAPIEKLDSDHQHMQNELNEKISEAQRAFQELNMSVDKLESFNKVIERYKLDGSYIINLFTVSMHQICQGKGCPSSAGMHRQGPTIREPDPGAQFYY